MKLRIAHVIVQPVLVFDDGDELSPGPEVQAVHLPLSKLSQLAESLSREVAALEAKLAESDMND